MAWPRLFSPTGMLPRNRALRLPPTLRLRLCPCGDYWHQCRHSVIGFVMRHWERPVNDARAVRVNRRIGYK